MKSLALIIMLSLFYSAPHTHPAVKKKPFGKGPDGKKVFLYTLKNKNGVEVQISNYGGTIVSIKVPDRKGHMDDVVLGYDTLSGYLEKNNPYFGATIGRYGNRIAKGTFRLDGKEYHVPINNGPNALHGGIRGFDKRVWSGKDHADGDGAHLAIHYVSKDGKEGYPGTLTADVEFTLTNENQLKIEYSASTDKDTVLNLTNHSYFNLAGQGNGDILKHKLKLYASRFTPVDATLIPTGELRKVSGTPFDFTQATAVGEHIGQEDEQLKSGGGYDHNFVLDSGGGKLTLAAEVIEPTSGRKMEVFTTEPGVQFYSGNFLDGSNHGKNGKVYQHRYGLCLETQHFPDSPNHPDFPSTVLKPGEHFHSTTVYRFTTDSQ